MLAIMLFLELPAGRFWAKVIAACGSLCAQAEPSMLSACCLIWFSGICWIYAEAALGSLRAHWDTTELTAFRLSFRLGSELTQSRLACGSLAAQLWASA